MEPRRSTRVFGGRCGGREVKRGLACYRALALMAVLVTSGCYESDVPIDPEPRIGVDPALVGAWRCLPVDADVDEEPATMVVKSDGARQYGVTWREGNKDPERYRAYISTARVSGLLNVQWLKEGTTDKTWVFVRYSLLRPDVLYLQVVSKDAVDDVEKSPTALRRTIERLRKNPSLYVDFCACVRARD